MLNSGSKGRMIGVLFYMKSAVVFPVVFYLNYHGNTNKKIHPKRWIFIFANHHSIYLIALLLPLKNGFVVRLNLYK